MKATLEIISPGQNLNASVGEDGVFKKRNQSFGGRKKKPQRKIHMKYFIL